MLSEKRIGSAALAFRRCVKLVDFLQEWGRFPEAHLLNTIVHRWLFDSHFSGLFFELKDFDAAVVKKLRRDQPHFNAVTRKRLDLLIKALDPVEARASNDATTSPRAA